MLPTANSRTSRQNAQQCRLDELFSLLDIGNTGHDGQQFAKFNGGQGQNHLDHLFRRRRQNGQEMLGLSRGDFKHDSGNADHENNRPHDDAHAPQRLDPLFSRIGHSQHDRRDKEDQPHLHQHSIHGIQAVIIEQDGADQEEIESIQHRCDIPQDFSKGPDIDIMERAAGIPGKQPDRQKIDKKSQREAEEKGHPGF